MATIRPNDNAPSGEVKYIFPTETIDLDSGGTHETDSRAVLAAAEAHPWLTVEYPEVEEISVTRQSRSVPYEDDVLAAPNSIAFDPDEIRKAEEAKAEGYAAPLAVEAGLDQSEEEEVAGTNVTLAADDAADETTDDKPARRSRRTASKED